MESIQIRVASLHQALASKNGDVWSFYADNVVRILPNFPPLIGKAASIQQSADFLESLIGAIRWSDVRSLVDERGQISMTERTLAFEHQDFGEMRQRQLCVQEWKNGRVVVERLYVMSLP